MRHQEVVELAVPIETDTVARVAPRVHGNRRAHRGGGGVERGDETERLAREDCRATTRSLGLGRRREGDPQRIAKLVKIQSYHCQMFAKFLTRLKNTPDGDGTLLDHSLFLFGSNMSNSNVHNHFPLPIAVVGTLNGKVKGDQHLRYPDHTPVANVLKAILDKTGVPVEKIGDSTEAVTL